MSGFSLDVQIEVNGSFVRVGKLCGTSYVDAVFQYDKNYIMDSAHRPISVSLPLQEECFSSEATQNYFEGLLPEGFSRQCVASNIHVDSDDYISILKVLGRECLGAIRIVDENNPVDDFGYKKLSLQDVKSLAAEGASKAMDLVIQSHLSLTGASGKAGLFYDHKEHKWYLPQGLAPSNYIVKQSHVRLKHLVVNEQLCLLTAKKLGIEIPESFIFECGESKVDDSILFATKRFDRFTDGFSKNAGIHIVPYRLHQEDFAQALGIKSSFKYEKHGGHYLKKMFDVLKNYSANPIEDQFKLWKITIFNYLIGNTDNHIKNSALLYSKDLKTIRLAPYYDVISTKMYDSSTDEMSLSINGKLNRTEIERRDFEKEAQSLGLGQKLAIDMYHKLATEFSAAVTQSARELMELGFVEAAVLAEKIKCLNL